MMAYPTVAQLKEFCGVSVSTDDTILGQILSGTVKDFEAKTSRVFVAASSTKNFPVERPWVYRLRRMNLQQDFVSVSALVNGDGTAISSDDYELYSASGEAPYLEIHLAPDVPAFFGGSRGNGRIAVTASWGFSASCPSDVFLAILEWGKFRYQQRSSAGGGQIQATSRAGVLMGPSLMPDSVATVIEARRRYSL